MDFAGLFVCLNRDFRFVIASPRRLKWLNGVMVNIRGFDSRAPSSILGSASIFCTFFFPFSFLISVKTGKRQKTFGVQNNGAPASHRLNGVMVNIRGFDSRAPSSILGSASIFCTFCIFFFP